MDTRLGDGIPVTGMCPSNILLLLETIPQVFVYGYIQRYILVL